MHSYTATMCVEIFLLPLSRENYCILNYLNFGHILEFYVKIENVVYLENCFKPYPPHRMGYA